MGNEPRDALGRASAEPLQRIARDRESAKARVRPLLDDIAEQLFDPDLTFEKLRRGRGIADKGISAAFRRATGVPPARYIRERRLETAARLLEETELPIWRISSLVGWLHPQTLTIAFRKWCGRNPSEYRNEWEGQPPSLPSRRSVEALHRLRAAMSEFLEPDELAKLEDELVALRPELEPRGTETDGPSGYPGGRLDAEREARAFESFKAEEVVAHLRVLDAAGQLEFLRRGIEAKSTRLVSRLCRAAMDIGREDRRHGVRLAEEIVGTVMRVEDWQRAARDGRFAVALAWLGNAKRLLTDLNGADEMFRFARVLLGAAAPSPAVVGEVTILEGAFWFHRRDFERALSLYSEAISALRKGGEPRPLVMGLIARATTRFLAGELEEALADQEEAVRLARSLDDPYLEHNAVFNLARIHVERGDLAGARPSLVEADRLRQLIPSPYLYALHLHLRGWLAASEDDLDLAIELLREAGDAFSRLGEQEKEGLVFLDLGAVLLRAGDVSMAADVARRSLSLFDSWRFGKESQMAMGSLREAIGVGALTADLLVRARRAVETDYR